MDLKTQLLSELSRANIDYVIFSIGDDPEPFRELIRMIFNESDPLPMRASWVVEGVTIKYPEMILPYYGKLIKNLRNFKHPGTRRNLLKIFTRMKIEEKFHGILLDICFEFLSDPDRTVAEKVYAMQIIANHLAFYPELRNEFYGVLDEEIPKNSAGFSSRVRQIKMKNRK